LDDLDDGFWAADCEACKRPRWQHSDFCSAIHMSGHYWRLGRYDTLKEIAELPLGCGSSDHSEAIAQARLVVKAG
jgi:hypothetical protein